MATLLSIAPVDGNSSVTKIDVGESSPTQLIGGAIDVSAFENLEELTCNKNGLTSVTGYENNSNIELVLISQNNLTGSIPDLSVLPNLSRCYFMVNQFTGPFPNVNGLSNLSVINCGDNQLTGEIPDITTFGLTSLTRWNIYSNNFTGELTGFSGTPSLQWILCNNNNFTGFTGPLPSTISQIRAYNNNFTQTAVDNILQAAVDAGGSNRALNVGGSGNSAPSAAGITNKNTLLGRGWSVTTN